MGAQATVIRIFESPSVLFLTVLSPAGRREYGRPLVSPTDLLVHAGDLLEDRLRGRRVVRREVEATACQLITLLLIILYFKFLLHIVSLIINKLIVSNSRRATYSSWYVIIAIFLFKCWLLLATKVSSKIYGESATAKGLVSRARRIIHSFKYSELHTPKTVRCSFSVYSYSINQQDHVDTVAQHYRNRSFIDRHLPYPWQK